MNKLQEIKEELRLVLKGKTIDAMVPPIVFAVGIQFAPLIYALSVALFVALLVSVYRLIKRTTVLYAIGGFIATGVAGAAAYALGEASGYFLPGMISNGAIALLIGLSVIIKRPAAMILSHITRGWPITWFARRDVYPAYWEVSLAWFVLFVARLGLLWTVYLGASDALIALTNIILGFPATLGALIASYFYGIWRLRNLGGPGVDEFINDTAPPWRGQTRGF